MRACRSCCDSAASRAMLGAMERVKARRTQRNRCESCGEVMPDYDVIHYIAKDKRSRTLCSRCFNTEVAQALGWEKFEHVSFEPVELLDCKGKTHEFHFQTHLGPVGIALAAFELRNGRPAGYRFQVMGDPEGDQMRLFARMIEKIRRGLSMKHLEKDEFGVHIADQAVR